jgi:hypothetical protein
MGVQHVIAMFGATVLAPILMGFDPNIAILMSGIGTLVFFLITGGKVPSYLGSSFAFIGVVIAATAYAGKGANGNIGVALGGIIACGIVYTLFGVLVHHERAPRTSAPGSRPRRHRGAEVEAGRRGALDRAADAAVVTGSVGGDRAQPGERSDQEHGAHGFDTDPGADLPVRGADRCLHARDDPAPADPHGPDRREHHLCGPDQRPRLGKPIDLARWPRRHGSAADVLSPVFEVNAMLLIAPVAVILVRRTSGHQGGRRYDRARPQPYLGRAFIGDGIATMVSGGSRRHRRDDLRREHG